MGLVTGAAPKRALGCGMVRDTSPISSVTAGAGTELFSGTVQTTHSDQVEPCLLGINRLYLLFCWESDWKILQVIPHRWISLHLEV